MSDFYAPLLNRLRAPAERALRDARIRVADLDEILLVGGTTRMPLIRKLAASLFGRFPSIALNPDEIVAQGAAVQAALKQRDAALEEIVLTDVCPYTLGIETITQVGNRYESGHYLPIIERNSVVPVSRVKRSRPSVMIKSTLWCGSFKAKAAWSRQHRPGRAHYPDPQGEGRRSGAGCAFYL